MKRTRRITRGGFTLAESIVAIIVISLMVPPAVAMLRDASTVHAVSLNNVRAVTLASAVLEQVLADASSPSTNLGMSAFASPSTYLNTAGTGLVSRMSGVSSLYSGMGFAWSLNIGGLVNSAGASTGTSADIYRYIRVTVTWNSDRSGAKSYVLGAMVTDLTP